MIRIVIVDDEVFVRAGFSALLSLADDIEVVGQAGDGAEALSVVRQTVPDVVLMDVNMAPRNGLEATLQIVKLPEAPRVLIMTSASPDNTAWQAFATGAHGFMHKAATPAQIIGAIRMVAVGGTATTPEVMKRLIDENNLRNPRHVAQARSRIDLLSGRHRDIILLVGRGYPNARIARELSMSENTVKSYVSRALEKLGVDNRTQAALLVRDSGLLDETLANESRVL
ncbi:response regulator transcription factor [Streptoverticillium reticulum]|uniref:response regulator transcription factor n=1 Tax=Streptoverticillium reticulum TaxID=1433415 RepID=UPI0039BFDC92